MANQPIALSPAGQDGLTVKRLRLGVGIIAALLPFVVLFGNMLFEHAFVWLGSISGSYYTQMRGVFVGSLWAVGVFLIAYRYERLDDIWSTIGGFFAILVSLFPTPPDTPGGITTIQLWVGIVHYVSAGSLFIVLAVFCLYIFAKSGPNAVRTPQKNTRNLVYRCTGGVIVVAIVAALVIAKAVPASVRDGWNTMFWCETVAIFAFAIAWLTKGGAFPWWNDPPSGGPAGADMVGPAPGQPVEKKDVAVTP
ncbi:MAG TPA: DUF998 domain-containing protein [Micromonosporaceae bacterium]